MDKVPGAEGAGKFYEEHAVEKEPKTPPSKAKEVGIRTIASSAAAAEAEKSRSSSSSEGSRSTSPTSETSSDSGVSGLSGTPTPQSKASTRSDYSSVSSSEVGACTIGLMPSDYSEFVHKALDLHKDDFVKTLPPTEKAAFMKKSPGEQKKEIFQWMTDSTREINNEKPRLEMRQCFNMPGVCANVALCCKDGPTRDALFENFTVPGVADDLNLVQAGSTTIEISSKGVDKSTPIRFLQDQENFQALLSNIGYTPGPLINALETKTVIVSDADGTIWGKPETGKPVESANLLNSEAKAGVLSYLSAGGVLVINTGNDPARTVRRFLPAFAGIPEKQRHELLSRIMFVSGGGGSFAAFVNGKLREFESYHYFEPTTPTKPTKLDLLYLGDDAKLVGNDMPAFLASEGKFICVAPESKSGDVKKSGIEGRVQYGETASTHNILTGIVIQARTNKAALKDGPMPPLFGDMEALLTNTRNIGPAQEIVAETIKSLGSRENLNQIISHDIDGTNPPIFITKEGIISSGGKLPPAEGAPLTYTSLMTRMTAFEKASTQPISTALTSKAAAKAEEDESLAMIQSFLDKTDVVEATKSKSVSIRILEPGNNDQATPIFIAYQIKQLLAEVKKRGGNPNHLKIEVLVMGKGGHATTAVFPQIGQMRQVEGKQEFSGTEEAISLSRSLENALKETKIPYKTVSSFSEEFEGVSIKLEKESTNTGQNVKNATTSYQEVKPDHQWVVAAKGSSLRQALTFAHQYEVEGEKCFDSLFSMPLPRGEAFIRNAMTDYQAATEFYAGMAENARLICYAMQDKPYIPPHTTNAKEFQAVLDNLFATYAKLENISVDEAKTTKTVNDLQGYFSRKFSTLEQAIPWSKAESTQDAFTQGAMKTLKKRTDAASIREALSILGKIKGTEIDDVGLKTSVANLYSYIRGAKGERQGRFLDLCKKVNQAFTARIR